MLAAPLPLNWESPKSILIRCAQANYFARIPHSLGGKVEEMNSAISLLCADHFSVKDMVRHIRSVFTSNKIDYEQLFYKQLSGVTEESPFEVRGIEVPYAELETVRHRVCTQCQSDKGHSKIFADLRAFTACPVHQCEYLEVAGCCEKSVKWSRVLLDSCYHCGAKDSKVTSKPQTVPEELELYGLIDSGQRKRVSEVLYLFNHLRRCFDEEVTQTGQVLGIALDFVLSRHQSLVDRLSRIYEHGEALPTRLLLSCLTIYPDSHIKAKLELIQSSLGRSKSGSVPWSGPKQAWFRLEQVQVGLKVCANTARKMVKQGHFCLQTNKSGYSVVLTKDLYGLIQWIQAEFEKPRKPAGRVLSGINAQNVVSNLKELKEGQLVVCGVDWHEGLKGLLFSKVKKATQNSEQGEAWLNVNDFAKRMSTYPDAIRRACLSGFISNKDITQKGATKYCFGVKFVEGFSKRYCFLSEVSKRMNGQRRTVMSAILKSQGIYPVSGPDVDGALVPIYLRSDIEGLHLATLIETSNFKSRAGRKKAGEVLYDQSKWVSAKDAKKRLKVNDQEIIALIGLGWLKVSIPPGREKDNFKYFSAKSVKSTETLLSGSIFAKQLWEEVGISKKELYLRFVESGLISVTSIGKRNLVSKKDADLVREDCRKFVSLSGADFLTGAPSKHFLNLVRTGRIQKASRRDTPSASHIDLLPRSMVRYYAIPQKNRSIN